MILFISERIIWMSITLTLRFCNSTNSVYSGNEKHGYLDTTKHLCLGFEKHYEVYQKCTNLFDK
jgi:hypothetical protein